jgi:hypothetical protein
MYPLFQINVLLSSNLLKTFASFWLYTGPARTLHVVPTKKHQVSLEPTHPPIQRVEGFLSPGLRRLGREAENSSPTIINVKSTLINIYVYPLPICLHGVVLIKQRDNFVFLPYHSLVLLRCKAEYLWILVYFPHFHFWEKMVLPIFKIKMEYKQTWYSVRIYSTQKMNSNGKKWTRSRDEIHIWMGVTFYVYRACPILFYFVRRGKLFSFRLLLSGYANITHDTSHPSHTLYINLHFKENHDINLFERILGFESM